MRVRSLRGVAESSRLRAFGLLIALSFAPACNAGAKASMPAPSDSCVRWTAEVCKQTGADSDTCDSLKRTQEIVAPAACAVALSRPDHLAAIVAERKRSCGELADKLCRDVGSYTRSCKLVREQTPRFEPERCVSMLKGYAQVLANLKQQAAQYQLSEEKTAKLTAGTPPSRGPGDARLQLVEFVDFENRDCVHADAIVRDLEAKYGDRLRLVVRQFPLPYNKHAHLAAEAALAAQAQGKYWEMQSKLLANQKELDRAALDRYAKELELNLKTFAAALDRKQYAPAVDADLALGTELNVVGMPTMFLDGERIQNAVEEQLIIDAIEEHLQRSR